MTLLRLLTLLLVLGSTGCGGGGGGLASDGGVSGTGISALVGNVAAIVGDPGEVAGIRVSIAGTDLTVETDGDGFFTLRGELAGAVSVVFERPGGGLVVAVDVQVPAGGTLELRDVVLDGASGEARPARRVVDFLARVDAVDCVGGVLFVVSRFDAERFVFTVRLDRTIIRDADGGAIRCEALTAGLDVTVSGLVQDDASIADGEVVVTPPPTPTPTRTRPAPTSTPRVPSPVPPTATRAAPLPGDPTPLSTEPGVRPTETGSRPAATATRVPVATATPTASRVRPSPTPTRPPQRTR